jgi:mono/diheme cytochrome c family protein
LNEFNFSDNDHSLYVAHHLPEQPSTDEIVASKISVIDFPTFTVQSEIVLPNGATGVKDICITPDNKYLWLTHILARYTVHTSKLEQGWMNSNAVSAIDIENQQYAYTFLLDDVDHGAANPWSICSDQKNRMFISHAGSHEISLIDYAALSEKLNSFNTSKPINQLSYLQETRSRIKLAGKGPRTLCYKEGRMFVGEYFSETLSRLDIQDKSLKITQRPLRKNRKFDYLKYGESLFHDAEICFQQWQSCSSCHPDGRVDGLNWDLLNDWIANPKNVKSLLLSHKTPPAMSTGVRKSAEHAVRAGMQFIHFMQRPEEEAKAIDAYLQSLEPLESPFTIDGTLTEEAIEGKKLFFSKEVGCYQCHPLPFYTDCLQHDVGTVGPYDFTLNEYGERVSQQQFDTPTLIELWRTAPYLHDGRYATIQEVITDGNHGNKRGNTTQLTPDQINNLAMFLLSL